jgi:predicted transport protein
MTIKEIHELLLKPADVGFLLNTNSKNAKAMVEFGLKKISAKWSDLMEDFTYDGLPLKKLQEALPYELDKLALDINQNYLKRYVSRSFILNYFEGVEKKKFVGKVRPLMKFLEPQDCDEIIRNWSHKHKCLMNQMEIEGRREVKKRFKRV